MADKWINTTEAVELTAYHVDYIRKLIKSGKVTGRKVMRDWQVSRASLLAHVKRTEKLGAKRGPKPGA